MLKFVKAFRNYKIFFNLTNLNICFTRRSNLVKYSFQIQVLNKSYLPILPSALTLHYNLHVLCVLLINNTIIH